MNDKTKSTEFETVDENRTWAEFFWGLEKDLTELGHRPRVRINPKLYLPRGDSQEKSQEHIQARNEND